MRQIPLLIGIIFLLLSWTGGASGQADTAPEVGKYAPSFELKDLDGRKVSLQSMKGKVVLLNFWATYCGPCKAEMPSLNALYEALKNEGLIVIAVSIDTSEKPAKSFVSGKRLRFPVLLDRNKEVFFDSYAAMGLPTSFLIDRNGIIVEKFVGPKEWDSVEMKNKITVLLRKK